MLPPFPPQPDGCELAQTERTTQKEEGRAHNQADSYHGGPHRKAHADSANQGSSGDLSDRINRAVEREDGGPLFRIGVLRDPGPEQGIAYSAGDPHAPVSDDGHVEIADQSKCDDAGDHQERETSAFKAVG